MSLSTPTLSEPADKVDGRSWQAELNCSFEPGPDRTIVRRTHSGPLSMQRPFFPEGDIAHVYMLHPPGGVVAGDRLRINIECVAGGKGLISTPGATKFYRSIGPIANVDQLLANYGGSLEWFPGENIFFSGSNVKINTQINLVPNEPLAWWEINCFGRPASNEPFVSGSVSSVLNIHVDKSLVLRERFLVNDNYPLNTSCGMRDNSVSATLVLMPIQAHCMDYVRKKLKHKVGFSSTLVDSMLIVRYLGDSSEDAKLIFSEVWSGLRPALNATAASTPRIWAT